MADDTIDPALIVRVPKIGDKRQATRVIDAGTLIRDGIVLVCHVMVDVTERYDGRGNWELYSYQWETARPYTKPPGRWRRFWRWAFRRSTLPTARVLP